MQITIELDTANDAYHGIHHSEVASEVLEHVGQKINAGYTEGAIQDINGNTTGKWALSLENTE